MGVTESKILAEKVLNACEAAEAGGMTKLSASFWNDKDVSRTAKNIFKQAPSNIRGPSRQNAADRAAVRSKTKIVVPDAVKKLQGKNERLLLPVAQSQDVHNDTSIDLSQASLSPKQVSLAGFYVLVTDIETHKEICNIRLRLFYVFFNRLKQKIQPQGFWNDAVTYLAQIICRSGLVNDSMKVIQDKVTTWVERGGRYELLANDLGGLGSLLVLPEDVPESVWAKDLPKAAGNTRRITMIDSLRQRGILEAIEGMNEVAEAHINGLWVPIYASIDAESQRLSQMRILDDERSLVAAVDRNVILTVLNPIYRRGP
ncbi:hypothetical protein BDV25DRAFT_135028 [Aspergillus avenaceus]|uniref:Uncharacterized protein n=1 Tax=Aspergillus avenaceus TaxID=36643 RepID=A0A5N6UAP5_ASPAV|nr:hypothetical protein BDV25DRAFT_135028 [Aspergillus avenaceus]